MIHNIQRVQSRQNKTVKEIVALHDKKERRKQRCFLVEGLRFVREALSSAMTVDRICFSTDGVNRLYGELSGLVPENLPILEVPDALFRQMAETENPQGVLAVVRIPDHSLPGVYRQGFRGLVLDNLQDPGNAGTVIRSAHALGFDAVVAANGSVDIFNSKVLRSTMGSIFHIPVIDNVDLEAFLGFVRERGIALIVSCVEGATPCHEADLSGEFFLAVGNEGKGVSDAMLTAAQKRVLIPMPGGAESFNAGVAASILMYESNRQRER